MSGEYNESKIVQISFTDACRTNIPMIDTEHEHLFELINFVLDAMHDHSKPDVKLEEYVEALIDYGVHHFAHEEAYLEKIHDRELVHQRLMHKKFMNYIHAIDMHGLTETEKRPLIFHLLEHNIQWLYKHVIYSDTMIGKVHHLADTVQVSAEDPEQKIYCPFEDRFLTGAEEIDDCHRDIFQWLNISYALLENGSGDEDFFTEMDDLEQLFETMEECFGYEDHLLHKAHYPDYILHRNAHANILDRLAECHEAETMGAGAQRRDFLEELLDYIYGWMVNHIIKMDIPAVQYLKGKGVL